MWSCPRPGPAPGGTARRRRGPRPPVRRRSMLHGDASAGGQVSGTRPWLSVLQWGDLRTPRPVLTEAGTSPSSRVPSGNGEGSSALVGLGLHHPFDEVRGHHVVVVVLGTEPAPAPGEGAEVDGVALDLGGGHQHVGRG